MAKDSSTDSVSATPYFVYETPAIVDAPSLATVEATAPVAPAPEPVAPEPIVEPVSADASVTSTAAVTDSTPVETPVEPDPSEGAK